MHAMNTLVGGKFFRTEGEVFEPSFFVKEAQLKWSSFSFFGGTRASCTAGLVKEPKAIFSLNERAMPFETVTPSIS